MSSYLLEEAPRILLPTLAVAIGDRGALFLQQVYYWCEVHRRACTENHYREGHWWTYNTVERWREQFPFWSERTIRRIIHKLEEQGVLLVGNYNRVRYDRTMWYAVDIERVEALVAAAVPADIAADRPAPNGPADVSRPHEPAGRPDVSRPLDEDNPREFVERPDADRPTECRPTICRPTDRRPTDRPDGRGPDGRIQSDLPSTCKRTGEPDARGQRGQLQGDGLPEPIPKRSQEIAPEVDKVWSLALQELELQMTRQMFATWVKPLALAGLDPGPTAPSGRPGNWRAAIRCPNDYSREWCAARLGVLFDRVLGGMLEAPVEIVYEVG